jgi:hypothetical protein
MSVEAIEAFYQGHAELIEYLIKNGEITYASDANDNFRRSLILAVASHFEAEISTIVRALPGHHSKNNPMLVALVDQKAVSRQYHTYFQWDGTNGNSFFALFGLAYRAACVKKVKEDTKFDQSVRAFLSLGSTRNLIVHQNFVEFSVEKTPKDIIEEFRRAQEFVDYVRASLLPPLPDEGEPVVVPSEPSSPIAGN